MTDTSLENQESAETDATQLILQDIQAGIYPPGTWLKQIDLETRYDKGRNEIRRALDRLTLKRIVEHVPNRGYHVYQTDGKQWQDISEIRIMLETGVVPKLISRHNAADIENLRALAQDFQDLLLSGTLLELYESNLRFHYAFLDLAGNQELHTVIAELRQRILGAGLTMEDARSGGYFAREHFQMIDALEARDEQELRRLIECHIRQMPE